MSPSQSDMWKWQPFPVRLENGFGMKVAIMPCCSASVCTMYRKKIARSQRDERVVVGEVLLELAVCVLVVVRVVAPAELVAVPRDRSQEVVAARETRHVVAGLLERVVAICDLDRAVLVRVHEEVLELEPHLELVALLSLPGRPRAAGSCAGSTATPRPRPSRRMRSARGSPATGRVCSVVEVRNRSDVRIARHLTDLTRGEAGESGAIRHQSVEVFLERPARASRSAARTCRRTARRRIRPRALASASTRHRRRIQP